MTSARPTIALLTAGGLAPCLSSSVASLIAAYDEIAPGARIIAYRNGFAGLLIGDVAELPDAVRAKAAELHAFGGSPLGNSRVKLSNRADCERRGLVAPGADPLAVAARQLQRDGVDILHSIGGDDTSLAAAELAAHLDAEGHRLTVVGLPKTIDNDVAPIRQTLGAWTAAEQGALFARNIIAEHSANPRMLVVHEIMGRGCGWLTAATAEFHHRWVAAAPFTGWLENAASRWDVHGVYLPERPIDLAAEAARLRAIMDEGDGVNLFIAEGAGLDSIVAEMEAAGEAVPRDPFGHVRLDAINPGAWFARRFADLLGADKLLVQKSGYFARSAPANSADRLLIDAAARQAAQSALDGVAGIVGQDEAQSDGRWTTIAFERIRGGKAFDTSAPWFTTLLAEIGQA